MKNTSIAKLFNDKSFWKQTAILALPIALQNLLTSSFVLVDTLMVGQLGDIALSSVGMAGQWSWLMNMIIFGTCSGASVLIAQYWGVDDKKQIRHISGIALTFALIITAFFFCMSFLAPKTVIHIFNSDINVIDNGSRYLKIACFSYIGSTLGLIFGAILRSTENVKLPMYSSLFTTVLNAFLDYSLIFGKFGFPEMGIEGAALATCISAWLGPIIMIIISLFEKNILYAPLSSFFGFDKALVKNFFIIAAPVILNETLWGSGTFLFNVIFANLGYENYAAVTIMKTIENIGYVFYVGLCNACCVMVGKNIGSGHIKNAIKDSKRFAVLLPAISVIVGIMLITFGKSMIIGLFNMNGELTEKTIKTAAAIIILYAIESPIRNIPYVFIVGIFRSGGDTKNGAKIDLLSLWFIALPLTFTLAFIVKAPFLAVYAGMYIGEDYLKAFLCLKHFRSYKWIKPVTEEGKNDLKVYLEESCSTL